MSSLHHRRQFPHRRRAGARRWQDLPGLQPQRQCPLEPAFYAVTPDQVREACALAGQALTPARATSDAAADFLDGVAAQIIPSATR